MERPDYTWFAGDCQIDAVGCPKVALPGFEQAPGEGC